MTPQNQHDEHFDDGMCTSNHYKLQLNVSILGMNLDLVIDDDFVLPLEVQVKHFVLV